MNKQIPDWGIIQEMVIRRIMSNTGEHTDREALLKYMYIISLSVVVSVDIILCGYCARLTL